MIRTVFAMAAATLIFAAVSGTSQAAPIAPLPAGVAADSSHGNVTARVVSPPSCWRGWHVTCIAGNDCGPLRPGPAKLRQSDAAPIALGAALLFSETAISPAIAARA